MKRGRAIAWVDGESSVGKAASRALTVIAPEVSARAGVK